MTIQEAIDEVLAYEAWSWLDWRLNYYRWTWDGGNLDDWLGEAMSEGYHGA